MEEIEVVLVIGSSRDSHRGGTSGRGANTGGRGARAGSNFFKLLTSSVAGQTEEVKNAEPYNSPNESETKKSSLFDRILGSANESTVYINGVETSGLIDTGSMITSVSESF